MNNPDLVTELRWVVDSAMWFWNKHNLSVLAKKNDLKGITQKISGADSNLEHRKECVDIFKKILPV